jgi:hypothetical protein
MTFALKAIASNGSEVEWSRTLMIAWLMVALALSVIEVFWLRGGFSSQKLAPVSSHRSDCLKSHC